MAAPRNGRNVVSRKMSIWVGHYESLELFCLWTKVHQFSFAQRGTGSGWWSFFSDVRYVDQFRRFAIKVESCQKSRRNLNVFLALPNFGGRAFQKLYARYHPYLASRRLEKFHEDSPTSPEVIDAHTLNFKPNFKFSGLIFFGGGPQPSLVCAR